MGDKPQIADAAVVAGHNKLTADTLGQSRKVAVLEERVRIIRWLLANGEPIAAAKLTEELL